MSVKILVIDDEEDLCEILQFNLEGEGYEVDVAFSAEEALKKNLKLYHLLLLDVMMGKISGFKLAKIIRQELKLSVPILFITAKDGEDNTLTGFSLGADDYIAKPFSIKEVIARVKAVVFRLGIGVKHEKSVIEVNGIELDAESKVLKIDRKEVALTKKEFEILFLLSDNMGRVYSRDEILERVWGYDIIVNERTVDVHVARLRKKMGSHGKLIRIKSGYGYYINV